MHSKINIQIVIYNQKNKLNENKFYLPTKSFLEGYFQGKNFPEEIFLGELFPGSFLRYLTRILSQST